MAYPIITASSTTPTADIISCQNCPRIINFANVKVAVVILNWNGRQLLETYLPSVVAHSAEAHIYVADNASTDDSVVFLKEHYPQITLIQNPTNSGYAGGYNEALKQVNEPLWVLLNSDVEVSPYWLDPMIAAFQNNDQLAAAQPKILDHRNPESFEYAGAAGGFIDKYGYPYCRGRIFDTLEKDEGQYNTAIDIFWATGACLFITKEAFETAGGFDERFFAHMEEIDLCWRLFHLGREVKCIPQSSVYHLGGGTLPSMHPTKTDYNFRNSLYCLAKNLNGFTAKKRIFVRMVLDGLAALRFLIKGQFGYVSAIFRAHMDFYRNYSDITKTKPTTYNTQNYYVINSIVWKYFVSGLRTFSKL